MMSVTDRQTDGRTDILTTNAALNYVERPKITTYNISGMCFCASSKTTRFSKYNINNTNILTMSTSIGLLSEISADYERKLQVIIHWQMLLNYGTSETNRN